MQSETLNTLSSSQEETEEQHEKATLYTSNVTKLWSQPCGSEVLIHPSNSPEFSPQYFHPFGPMTRYMAEGRIANDSGLVGSNLISLNGSIENFKRNRRFLILQL